MEACGGLFCSLSTGVTASLSGPLQQGAVVCHSRSPPTWPPLAAFLAASAAAAGVPPDFRTLSAASAAAFAASLAALLAAVWSPVFMAWKYAHATQVRQQSSDTARATRALMIANGVLGTERSPAACMGSSDTTAAACISVEILPGGTRSVHKHTSQLQDSKPRVPDVLLYSAAHSHRWQPGLRPR